MAKASLGELLSKVDLDAIIEGFGTLEGDSRRLLEGLCKGLRVLHRFYKGHKGSIRGLGFCKGSTKGLGCNKGSMRGSGFLQACKKGLRVL